MQSNSCAYDEQTIYYNQLCLSPVSSLLGEHFGLWVDAAWQVTKIDEVHEAQALRLARTGMIRKDVANLAAASLNSAALDLREYTGVSALLWSLEPVTGSVLCLRKCCSMLALS